MKNTIKYSAILWIAIIAIAAVIGFSACAFDDDTPQIAKKGNISETLKFENISRLAFMGGSLIYNPDVGASGQISKGATVAVRLSKVETNQSAANPDEKFKETWRAFGYIKVDSVNTQSITLAYSEYNEAGVLKKARTVTVNNGSSGDLNGDGLPDVSFIPPAFKRSGMENAVYLTFTASQGNGSVGMYSVIPEQYSRQAYPNGVMGVNPDGKLIIMKYSSSGARAAIRGAEHGDIVIDNMNNNYATIRNGRKFRNAAERISDTGDDITIISTTGISMNTPTFGVNDPVTNTMENGVVRAEDSSPVDFEEEGDPPYFIADEFTVYATPQMLYGALPASLKKSASPSSEAGYINAINTILETSISTFIDEVLDGKTDPDQDLIAEANSLKSETTGSVSSFLTVFTNRVFLAHAYPELCQTPAAQTIGEMFPIFSVSFSAGDIIIDEISADIRRANISFASDMQNNNSRAVYTGADATGYTKFMTARAAIEKTFDSSFTKIPIDGLLTSALKVKESDSGELRISIGLFGSYTSYSGKIEMGVGAAALFIAQLEGLSKVSTTLPFINKSITADVWAGPLLFKVGASINSKIELSAAAKSANTFAGFVGIYGGRAWVGADYGFIYFRPYAKAQKVADNAFYAGPRRDIAPANNDGTINIQIKPILYIGPTVSLYGIISAKVGADIELPNTLKVLNYGESILHSMDMTFAGRANAWLKVGWKKLSWTKTFGDWEFTPRATVNVVKEHQIYAK